jgi:hypothetical protein
VHNKPIGIANKILPSILSLRLKVVRIVGILEAHAAYPNPEIKKKIALAILLFRRIKSAASSIII